MPNSKVIAGHVDNLGARPFMRTKIVVNLAYDTAPEAISSLCAGIRELIQSHPDCKRNSVAVFLNEFNVSGLGVLVQFNLQAKDWLHEQATKDQIFVAILTLLKKLNVKLTTPPHEVRVTQNSELPTSQPAETSPTEAMRLAGEISSHWKRVK
jgi:MscS family membrane protein